MSGESVLRLCWSLFSHSGLVKPRPHRFVFSWLAACAIYFPNSPYWRRFLSCHEVPVNLLIPVWPLLEFRALV